MVNEFKLYLSTLSDMLNNESFSWHEVYSELALNGFQDKPKAYSLIYPGLYSQIINGIPNSDIRVCKIRGSREFRGVSRHLRHCQAEDIFGTECKLDINSYPIEIDHYFPYSLGGTTKTENRRFLSKFHNSLKGKGLAYYDWGIDIPIWVIDALESIFSEFRKL